MHRTSYFSCRYCQFWSAAGWNNYADRKGTSENTNIASIRHSHTWTCDEDGHLVAPDAHCPGILRRHDGLLNKRDARILLLCLPRFTKKTLKTIRVSHVRKLAFLLGGTGGRSSSSPKDGPVWFGSGGYLRLDWLLQANDSVLDFTAPWRQVRWMRDSLSSMSMPAVAPEHQGATLKHIRALHNFADSHLQGLIFQFFF